MVFQRLKMSRTEPDYGILAELRAERSELEERLADVQRSKQSRITRGAPLHPRNIAILKPSGRFLVSASGLGYTLSETGPDAFEKLESRLAAVECKADGHSDTDERIQDAQASVRENAQSVVMLDERLKTIDDLVASQLETVSALERRLEELEEAVRDNDRERVVAWDDIEDKPDFDAMHDGCSRMLVMKLKRSRVDKPFTETFSVHRAGYARIIICGQSPRARSGGPDCKQSPPSAAVIKLDGRKLLDGIGIIGEGSHTLLVETGLKDRSREMTVVVHM
jgi:hypothetical protein